MERPGEIVMCVWRFRSETVELCELMPLFVSKQLGELTDVPVSIIEIRRGRKSHNRVQMNSERKRLEREES